MIIKNIDKQEAMTNIAIGEAKMERILAAAAVAVLLSAGPVLAQNKIQIGCTATSELRWSPIRAMSTPASVSIPLAGACVPNAAPSRP